jgi:hypothetical protein
VCSVLSSAFKALSIRETASDSDEKRSNGISSEVLAWKIEAATTRVHYSDRHYKNILKVQHCDSMSYNTAGDSYSLELFPVNSRKLHNKITLTLLFTFQFSFKATSPKLSKNVVYITVHTISVRASQSTELLRSTKTSGTLPYTEILLRQSYETGYMNTMRRFALLQQVVQWA